MRGYDDPCGIARALGLIGERWALLVVRELVFGPKRFTDLRHGLHGISDNVLSQRLRELEQADIVRRRKLGPPSSTWSYELTERGRELEPVLTALGQWGSRFPVSDSTHRELSIDALIFALTTTFDADIAGRLETVVQLNVGDDRFRAEVRGGHFRVARGNADKADVTIIAEASTLQALVFAGQSLAQAEAAGEATIVGDRCVAEHLLRCFPPSVRSTRVT
ncbi:winged helix-turn-helix transcriptional regulator [Amycolatopsis sp. NPDC059657]|uniref:winged helix-turn-helix transcriptional regulator n=1 Tax=Amycolatopsis sp. NPDC059657 TaxID=3346899 RepID=UPI00366F0AEF